MRSLIALLILASSSLAGPLDDPAVMVNKFGSGTVIRIKSEILILTAGHVVCDSKTAGEVGDEWLPVEIGRYVSGEKKTRLADVLMCSPEEPAGFDLALLKPRSAVGLSPVDWEFNLKLGIGEDCWYCGFPRGEGPFLEKSIVQSLQYKHLGSPWTIIGGLGTFGNSGSSMRVKRGDKYPVAGVITRIVWSDGKAPLMCKPPAALDEFIKSYVGKKKGK